MVAVIAITYSALPAIAGETTPELFVCKVNWQAVINRSGDGSTQVGGLPVEGTPYEIFDLSIQNQKALFSADRGEERLLGQKDAEKLRSELEDIPCKAAAETTKLDPSNPIFKMACATYKATLHFKEGKDSLLYGYTRSHLEAAFGYDVLRLEGDMEFNRFQGNAEISVVSRGVCAPK